MLELVKAVRFIKMMGSGRNRPVLFGCEETDGGDLVEVVVKFSSPQCGVGGIIREAISALLAADLDLPVPRPFLVVLDDGLLDAMDMVPKDAVDSMRDSRFPTFGSQFAGVGASTYSPARTISARSELEAAEIFAFDALTLNADRRVQNSNLLYDGQRFVMFDHELALNCAGVGRLINPAPWQAQGLAHFTQGNSQHVLYRRLLHSNPKLDRLKDAWSKLKPERFSEYADALPNEWNDHSQIIDEVIAYLGDAQTNINAAFAEVQRVLQ